MNKSHYSIFGVGSGPHDLHYIGWTQKSISEEREKIFSNLADSGIYDIARWVKEALYNDKISIFEIETAPSMEEAKDSVMFWCQYYHSLGLDVVAIHC